MDQDFPRSQRLLGVYYKIIKLYKKLKENSIVCEQRKREATFEIKLYYKVERYLLSFVETNTMDNAGIVVE